MKLDFKSLFKVGLAVFAVYLCIIYWNKISVTIISAALPIIVGLVIAFLVNIVMSLYERRFFPSSTKKFVKKIRTPICMLGGFITVAGIITAIVLLIAPQIVECIDQVIQKLPDATNSVVDWLNGLGFVSEETIEYVNNINWPDTVGKMASSSAADIVNILIRSLTTVFSVVINVFLSIVFAIYILLNKNKLKAQFSRVLKHYLKPNWYRKTTYVIQTFNGCFRRYIVGQCTEAIILGVLCTVGMLILRLPYATMIGPLISFAALIPIAGSFIGAIVGAFMILTVNPTDALIFLIFIVVLQQVEGYTIYPKVVGTSIGLPSIWVLAAVTMGGGLFGIPGMLLSVPFTASIWRIIHDDVNKDSEEETDLANGG